MKYKQNQISIFNYKDYRLFLKDWYELQKKTKTGFSFRSFAKKAGFKTSNFLYLVMNQKRNLSDEGIQKFILGLELNKQEADFFKNLVEFNQSKNAETKNQTYKKLIRSRKYRDLKPLENAKYAYYSKWYHPVIREMIASPDFDGTFQWISDRLQPKVSVEDVEKSIHLLNELDFITKDKTGKWIQSQTILSTGQEVTSTMIHHYHKTVLNLSQHLLDHLSPQQRDVSTMTLGIKKNQLSQIKQRIFEFRQEILALVSDITDPDEVIQFNMQLFPLTKVKK